MENKVYELMDWAAIEAITYSEEDNPHRILGARVMDGQVLIQAFFPDAQQVSAVIGKKEHPMIMEDEAGFFAILLDTKKIPDYSYLVTAKDGSVSSKKDPYLFQPQITESDTKKFNAGICYQIYDKLGAHPMSINGVNGVYFAVWAPNALRVSVVGDFNAWDGRVYQMRRLWDSGIFELFIPELEVGCLYKYEIKAKGGLCFLKADPYANEAELRPNSASVVADLSAFSWSDQKYLAERKKKKVEKEPISIYELHLGSWQRPVLDMEKDEYREYYTYRELAPVLADYIKEMGFTHVEFMPVMEYPYDRSWGYQVTGYYAPTSRYGSPEDFMYLVDYLHNQNIGVILDWVPAHFPRDTFGLSNFDGTCLYEHQDPRQGYHPHWGTLIYNYGRPEVSNFLIANALFWADKYHIDGIRMDAVASMLYLDYGKQDGEWIPNIYGGHENLEAVELLKHLNSIFSKKFPQVMLIAEESTAWPKVTGNVEEDSLGFDFKWNMGWMNDFTGYMQTDPLFRKGRHNDLTFSMIYAYSENFILPFSHDEVVHGKGSMIQKMPGDREHQFANLRAAYGFMYGHPGKKLMFMGQEFAQVEEWDEEKAIQWGLLDQESHLQMQNYVKALNHLYQSHPALFAMDYHPDGFQWLNCLNADENTVTFYRSGGKREDTLVFVCNFSDVLYEKRQIGVPYPGKYKEILNSNQAEFGGSGIINARLKQSKKEECEGQQHSITITIPPLSVAVFSYTKTVKKAVNNTTAKKAEPKKSESKKAESKKPVKKSLKQELVEKIEAAEQKK